MLKIQTLFISAAFGVILLGALSAQDAPVELPESAERYYKILRKSPERSYLYERFLNSWLESMPLGELPVFFEQQANLETSTAEDLILAGIYHARKGDIDSALPFFEGALEKSPGNVVAHFERAKLYGRNLAFEKAIVELDAALANSEISEDQKLELGRRKSIYLTRLGQTDEALAVWQELLAANPDDHFLHEDIIESLASEGLLDEAIESALALVEKTTDPHSKLTRTFRVAELHTLNEDSEEAVETYTKLLPKTGTGSWVENEILSRVGTLHRREDDLEGLRDWIDNLVQDNPQRIGLLQFQANLEAELGDHELAAELYRKVIERSPGDRLARTDYVDFLADSGNVEEAIRQQETIIEQSPDDAAEVRHLATLLARAERWEDAGDQILKAFKMSPKAEIDFLSHAKHLEKFEQHDAAQTLLKEGAKALPESEEIPETLATLLLRHDKTEEAFGLCRELAKESSSAQLIRLAKILTRAEEAAEAHELLVSRQPDFLDDFDFLTALIQISTQTKQRTDLESLTLKQLQLANTPETLERALQLALFSFSDSEEREALLERLREKTAPLPVELSLMAQLLSREGQTDEATRLLTDAVETHEGENRTLFLRQLILLYTRDKDWDRAAKTARTILNDPGGRTSKNIQNLVSVLSQGGRETEALPYLADWKVLSPGSTTPWLTEADLLYRLDRGDDAIASILKATSKFPDATELKIRLARLHEDIGDPVEASRIYWKLYEETEEPTLRLRRVADLYEIASYNGELDALIQEFKQRRQSNQTSPAPILALAKIHELDSDLEAQEKALTAASELRNDDIALLNQISAVQLKQDKWEESIATLETAARLDKTPRSRQRIAKIEIEFGDPEKGYRQLTEIANEAGGDDSSFAQLVEEIADSMLRSGDIEIATKYLDGYLDIFPDNYRIHYLLGVAYEEAGEHEKAIQRFLRLLRWDGEMDQPLISTLTPSEQKAVGANAGQMGFFAAFSNDTRRIIAEYESANQIAYEHRNRNGGRTQIAPSLAARYIQPPLEVEEAERFALLHLRSLYQEIEDEAQKTRIIEGAEQSELPLAKYAIALSGSEHGSLTFPLEHVRSHPDDSIVQAQWLYPLLYSPEPIGVTESDYLNAYRTLEATNPSEAYLAILLGVHFHGEEPFQKHLDDTLNYLQNLESATADDITLYSLAVGTLPFNQQGLQINDARIKLLSDAIARNAKSSFPGNWSVQQLTMAFSNHLLKEGDIDTYLDFHSQRFQAHLRSEPQENPAFMQYFLYVFQNGFNLGLYEKIHQGAEYSLGTSSDFKTLFASKEAQDRVKKIQPPVLRGMLSEKIHEAEDYDQVLKELRKKTKPSTDLALFLAKEFSETDKNGESIELLNYVRKNTKHNGIRSYANALIAHLAQISGTEEERILSEGQKAMLRIIAEPITSQYHHQIAQTLTALQMPKEASKFTASANRGSGVRRVLAGTKKPAHQKIKELHDLGKKEEAIKLASREMKNIGREASKSRYGNWQNSFWELRRNIVDNGIAKPALELLEEENGEASLSRLYETGIAAELFQTPSIAERQYEKILARDPNNAKAISRLIWIDAEADRRDEVIEHFKRLELPELPKLVAQVSSEMNGIGYDSPDHPALYNVVSASLSFVPEVAEETNQAISKFQWVQQNFSTLIREQDWGSVEMPFLFDRVPTYSDRDRSGRESENLASEKLRKETLDTFYKNIETIPAFQRASFSMQSTQSIRENDANWDDWIEKARGLLDPSAAYYRSPLALGSAGNSDNVMTTLYTPEEFLIVDAWKKGNREATKEIIANAPTSSRNFLTSLTNLYFSPLEEFSEHASALTKASRGSITTSNVPNQFHVIWAMRDRHPEYETAFTFFKENSGISVGRVATPGWYRTFVYAVSETKNYPGHIEFIRDLRDLALGEDLEAIESKLAEAYKNGGGQLPWGSPESEFATSLLCPIALHEEYLFPSAHVLKECGFNLRRFFDQMWKYRTSDYFENPKTLARFMEHTPWFGSVSEIAFLDSDAFRSSRSLFDTFLAEFNDDLPKQEFRAILGEKPNSFFKCFSMVLLNHPRSARGNPGLSAVAAHLDEFKNLNEEQSQRWIATLERAGIGLGVEQPGDNDKSPEAEAARWLLAQGSRTLEKEVADFLSYNQASDSKVSPDAFEDRMESLIVRLMKTDYRKSGEIFLHGWDLISKEQRNGGWSGSTSYNWWPVGANLIDDFMGRNDNGLNDLAFFVYVQSKDRKGRFPHSGWDYDYKFTNRIRREIDANGGVGNLNQSIPILLRKLHDLIGEDPEQYTNILALPFHDFISKLPKPNRVAAIEAADSVAESDAAEAHLAHILATAGRFYMANAPSEQVTQKQREMVPELDSWKPVAIAQLSDDSKTSSFLAPLANLYCCYSNHEGDDDIAMLAGEILARGFEKDHRFNGYNLLHCLRDYNKRNHLEGWDKTTDRLLAGWWRANRHNDDSRNTGRAFDPVNDVILTLIDTALRRGEADALTRFRREFGSQLYGYSYSRLPLLLVSHGYDDEATEFLKNHADLYDATRYYNETRYFQVYFTPEVKDRVEDYVSQIDNPELATFASTFLTAAFDVPAKVKKPVEKWVGRTGRMYAAAKRFRETVWTDPSLRDKTVQQILVEPHTASAIGGYLEGAYKKFNAQELVGLNNYQKIEYGMRIPAAHCWNELLKGNPEPFDTVHQSLLQAKGSKYYCNEAFEALSDFLWNTFRKRALGLSQEEIKNLLPAFQALASVYDVEDRHFTDHEELTCTWIIAASMCGETESVEAWLANLPEAERKKMAVALSGHHSALFPCLTNTMRVWALKGSAPIEVRQQILIDFFRNPLIHGAYQKAGQQKEKVFADIVAKRILTPAQLLEIGEEMHAAWPRAGSAALELNTLANTEKNLEQALRWSGQALEDLPENAPAGKRGKALIAHAENLAASNLKANVKTTLAKLDETMIRSLPPREKRVYNELRKNLP